MWLKEKEDEKEKVHCMAAHLIFCALSWHPGSGKKRIGGCADVASGLGLS